MCNLTYSFVPLYTTLQEPYSRAFLQSMAATSGVHVAPDVAEACVRYPLAQQRAKPHFGNAGAVRNLLERGKANRMADMSTPIVKIDGLIVLRPIDMFDPPAAAGSARAALSQLVNAEDIVKTVDALELRVAKARRTAEAARLPFDAPKFLKNYAFVGPPGTGKTTVARAFGEVFHSLGLLASAAVVECKAIEMLGSFVGQTAPLVKAKLNAARGGVLFIDEAYALAPPEGGAAASTNAFAAEAVLTLLGAMTDPVYEGRMLIIFAGYTADIDRLFAANPGFTSRVSERMEFKPWSPPQCLTLLRSLAAPRAIALPPELDEGLLAGFADIASRPGYASARDVKAAFDKMCESRDVRDVGGASGTGDDGPFTYADVRAAVYSMISSRPYAAAVSRPLVTSAYAPLSVHATPPVARSILTTSVMPKVERLTATSSFDAETLACSSSAKFDALSSSVSATESFLESTFEAVGEAAQSECAVATLTQTSGDDDNDGLFPLYAALIECGYSATDSLAIATSRILPLDVVALSRSRSTCNVSTVAPRLTAQCASLVERFAALVAEERAELARRIAAQEAIQRALADAVLAARLVAEEAARCAAVALEQKRQVALRRIGRCPAGYEWHLSGGGYRCGGGSHWVGLDALPSE
jgi:SpoVK/Ycf46/Vps4 family AAA+-type ATPase